MAKDIKKLFVKKKSNSWVRLQTAASSILLENLKQQMTTKELKAVMS